MYVRVSSWDSLDRPIHAVASRVYMYKLTQHKARVQFLESLLYEIWLKSNAVRLEMSSRAGKVLALAYVIEE